MKAKTFLNSVRYMEIMLQGQLEEIERLEAIATGTTSGLGEKVTSSHTGGKVATIAVNIADMMREYEAQFEKLCARKREASACLQDILAGNHYNEFRILRAVYVSFMSVSDAAKHCDMSYSTASKAHLHGLRLVDEWLEAQEKLN